MSLIESIRRDRDAGTPGFWSFGGYDNDTGPDDDGFWEWWVVESDHADTVAHAKKSESDARRIARVPTMEAALLAANDCDLILAEVEYLKPERLAGFDGEYWVQMPADDWKALLSDVARVRAAYRAAVEAKP